MVKPIMPAPSANEAAVERTLFPARNATFGALARPGLRALFEAPEAATGTGTPPATAPAVLTIPRDELGKIIREELGGAIGEKFATERAATLERVAKLDEAFAKLTSDFARMYQGAVANPTSGGGIVERNLVMRPHESVDEFMERHEVTGGRVMFDRGAQGSGGRGIAIGRASGLAGVRDQRGVTASRMMRAYAAAERKNGFRGGGNIYDLAATHASKQWGDKLLADMIKETEELIKKRDTGTDEERKSIERSLGTTSIGSGAAFVKPDFASFFMDYLFSKIILFNLGAMSLPIKNELEFPFIDVAMSAAFRGEATGPNAGQPGDNFAKFVRKIVSAIAAVTNEWLDEADYGPDVFIRNHLSRALAVLVDLRAFRGRGTDNELRGADYWIENAGASHFFNRTRDAGSGKATFKTINRDLLDMMRIVSGENIDLMSGRPGYALQNETFYSLMRVLSGTALELRPFADELRGGSLQGAPVQVTTQFPTNMAGDGLGTGTNNKVDTYFGEWSTFAVGQNGGIEIKAMDGAAYKDVNGTTQPGFTNNETVIRADWKLDTVALQRGKELTRCNNDWHAEF